MKINEMIAVLQAAQEGKKIQSRDRWANDENSWQDNSNPAWAFGCHDYRVKPEPREFWIHQGAPDTVWHPQILEYEPINPEFIHVREVIE